MPPPRYYLTSAELHTEGTAFYVNCNDQFGSSHHSAHPLKLPHDEPHITYTTFDGFTATVFRDGPLCAQVIGRDRAGVPLEFHIRRPLTQPLQPDHGHHVIMHAPVPAPVPGRAPGPAPGPAPAQAPAPARNYHNNNNYFANTANLPVFRACPIPVINPVRSVPNPQARNNAMIPIYDADVHAAAPSVRNAFTGSHGSPYIID